MGWMAHRKWKEAKQLPGTAGPCNMLGCCFISFHFLWAIHPIRPVLSSFGNTTCRVKTEVTKGLFDHLFIVKRAAASCSFRPLSLSLSLSLFLSPGRLFSDRVIALSRSVKSPFSQRKNERCRIYCIQVDVEVIHGASGGNRS